MFFYEHHQFEEECMYNSFVLENCDFPYHFHKSFELIFVYDGHLSMTINDKEYLLKKNELAFIFPNQLHSFASRGFSHIVLLIFPSETIGSFYKKYKNMFPETNVITYIPSPCDKLTFSDIYECKSFIYQICSKLISQTGFIPYNSSVLEHKNILYALISYVQENYKETCTLRQASKKLGYDYYYLSKFFSEKMGMTFTSYLNQYRISQSCLMLSNTNETISSIAAMCGYDNMRTFNRNFSKYTNTSPSEYKKSAT